MPKSNQGNTGKVSLVGKCTLDETEQPQNMDDLQLKIELFKKY